MTKKHNYCQICQKWLGWKNWLNFWNPETLCEDCGIQGMI